MKLEVIQRDASLTGVVPAAAVTVVGAFMVGPDSLQLVFKTPDGRRSSVTGIEAVE